MSDIVSKDNLFRPAMSKAESKAEVTNRTAWDMLNTEAARREAKTARLRAARLASEAAVAAPAREKRRSTKTSTTKRGRSSM